MSTSTRLWHTLQVTWYKKKNLLSYRTMLLVLALTHCVLPLVCIHNLYNSYSQILLVAPCMYCYPTLSIGMRFGYPYASFQDLLVASANGILSGWAEILVII